MGGGKDYLSFAPLIRWQERANPLDWAAEFGRTAPLELEIGFGNGERLIRAAKAQPERDFIGVDVSWPSTRRCLRKIALARVANVRLLQVDARLVLRRLIPPHCLSQVEALFPCPWPEKRHQHRRLFDREFLTLMNSRLIPGGGMRLVSDYGDFFAWLLEESRGCGFQVEHRTRGPGLETKYERKWRRQGQRVFYELSLTKTEHQAIPAWEEPPVHFPSVASFDPRRFPLGEYPGEERVIFKEMLYDPELDRGMLHTVVVELEMNLALWLEFSRQPDGSYRIAPAPGCPIPPSRGLQRAVALAADLARESLKGN